MPCSASGMALPTIKSSTKAGFTDGTCAIKCLITSAAKSSGRMVRNPPRLALATAVRYPAIMYAFMFVID